MRPQSPFQCDHAATLTPGRAMESANSGFSGWELTNQLLPTTKVRSYRHFRADQDWPGRRHRLLVACSASLRKQWALEHIEQ